MIRGKVTAAVKRLLRRSSWSAQAQNRPDLFSWPVQKSRGPHVCVETDHKKLYGGVASATQVCQESLWPRQPSKKNLNLLSYFGINKHKRGRFVAIGCGMLYWGSTLKSLLNLHIK